MHSWLLLVFTLAVPLASSRTAAQFTTTASSASSITDTTSSTTAATTVPTTFQPKSTPPTTAASPTSSHQPIATTTTSSPTSSHQPIATTTTSSPTSSHQPIATTTTSSPTSSHQPIATTTTSSPTSSHQPIATTTTSSPTSSHQPTATTTTSSPTSSHQPTATTTTSSPTSSHQPTATTTTSSPTSSHQPIATTTTSSPTSSHQPIATTTTSSPTSSHQPIATTTTSSPTSSHQPTATTTTSSPTSSHQPIATTTTSSPTSSHQPTAAITSVSSPPRTSTAVPAASHSPPTNTTNTSTPFTTTLPPTTTTSYPTTTRPGPTAPLVCDNGGILLQSVCICPDEWTGPTCSKENFCPAQLGQFSFPRTPIGWFAYSEEICAQGTKGAGKPRATTRCVLKNGSPSFERPQEFKCDQTLSDLQLNLTNPADFESLAASAQILTSNPEELTAEDVTAAAQIANTLLQSPNATESVRVAAVATVSQLLNTSTADDGTENNATLGLTVTLDELSLSLSLTRDSSTSQLVQPNLAIQSAQVLAADTQGVQFTSLSGTSGSLVANRIKLNTNTSSVVEDEGGIADALIYIQFPPEAVSDRQKPSNVLLGFVLYQNDRFFQSKRYRSKRSNIRVLSGSVSGQERSVVPQHVEMVFRPTISDDKYLHDFACVFWDYSIEDWSTAGCSKVSASDERLRCFCNHTTNFAAFFSLGDKYKYAALDWISVVGLSISIICLIITITHDISEMVNKEKEDIKNADISQLCTCVSLLAFIITFVSGVVHANKMNDAPVEISNRTNTFPESDEHVEPDGGSCSAVAALLHFFLLANFMWNSLQGTVLLLVRMKGSLPSYWTPLSVAVGWGVPAVVMAITLAATYRVDNPLGYRQEEFCWLAALDKEKQFHFGRPLFGAFLLPVGLIMIYNIAVLVTVALKDLRKLEDRRSMSKILFTFSLPVVMGVSWTLGYLVLVTDGQAHLALSIIFCLCTTTQGLQIFIFVTARKQSFRDVVFRSPQHISSLASQSPQYISSLASRSAQSISSLASRSAQSISSMASQSAQHISSIHVHVKRRKYRFNMNTEGAGGDDYFRFPQEPITLVEFSASES